MMRFSSFPTRAAVPAAARLAPALVAVTMIAVAWYLLQRNLGLNPVLFADEWYYSKMSRLQPLADAMLPSWLYLWLFRASNACGDGFLDCVRTGNVLFWVASAPFIYAIARQVCGRRLSWVVVTLALAAPLNLYTAMFMPESTYYFGFCVLAWLALTRSGWPRLWHGLALGVVLGLMSLVKVHALFLVPAVALYLLCLARPNLAREGLPAAALAVLATFAVKFGLGYVFAGAGGLTLWGPFYGSAAHGGGGIRALLGPAFINARGHLELLAVLFALPLAALLGSLPTRAARTAAGEAAVRLQLFSLLALGAAVGMTVAYTASIAGFGPLEAIRLHVRYYSVVFPLLLAVAAHTTVGRDEAAPGWWRVAVALALGALVLLGVAKLPHYSLSMVDGPDIAGLPMDQAPGLIVAGVQLLALLLWALRYHRVAGVLFVFVAMPLFLVTTNLSNGTYLSQLIPGWPADNGGRAAHRIVPAAERKFITVAGDDAQEIMRAQFQVDDKDSAMLELPKGQPLMSYQIPPRGKWLLVIGKHALPASLTPVAATADYQLVRLDQHRKVIGQALLSAPFGNGLLAGAEGLSHAVSWGRWSDARQVVLHFAQPLPRRLFLILRAMAYGDNANQPFVLHAGTASTSFKLGPSLQEIGLWLDTDGQQRTITIDVPHPQAPAAPDKPGDHRLLGIGIAEIDIASGDSSLTAH